MTREITHMKAFMAALESLGKILSKLGNPAHPRCGRPVFQ